MALTSIKKTIALFGCVLLTAAVASPVLSQPMPEYGGSLVITTTPEPSLITNALSSAPTTNEVATKLFDGLLEYDMDLNPLPSLAESWEVSEDGKTVTFNLRKGVYWHDGEPFTSSDVQFTLLNIVKEYHPRGKQNLGPVESIDTPDEHTVILNLVHPYPPMLKGLSSLEVPILPRHIYEDTDIRNNPAVNAPIGTGPFKFARWDKGSFIELEKNENYWREGRPYLDRVIFRFIADASTRSAALERGEVHVATFGSINPVEMRRLAELPEIEIAEGGYEALAPVITLELNTKRPPMDDKRVRQAIAYAIDRDFITNAIWYGFGKPAMGPLSSVYEPSGLYTEEGVRRFDVEDRLDIANKLLDEAGQLRGKDGIRFKIVHDVAPNGEDWRRMGEYIKQALTKVGIDVELRNSDAPTFMRQVYGGEYDFWMASGWPIGMADPSLGLMRYFWSKNIRPVPYANTSRYENHDVDVMWEAAQIETNPAKRAELFHNLQRQLVEDSPMIWLMEKALVSMQHSDVQDLITSPFGVRGGLADTWIKK
ncbi:ABC transporter substrate-binding protein [Alcaligenes endophyticus]|uniref:ABC transporter substrate-binding protein n=1 Tax=Alcaligenes endophyticus TaxID=1929088 RepID=A0ABT8EHG7_9BURK|nr:ABC transporter substrate-binding protein [Alcaligenes endophyticus]MCX5592086.1 ABC transporter substrate-binding protein [Alcaligenes endophyticus]MDN4120733.1 ABC transporter substrate-binding protein [Alcaligenes endophyticus]